MKVIPILLFFCYTANATTYYVKSNGGTGSGLNDSNAWSISKLNVTGLLAGDSVLFKRGNTFYSRLNAKEGVYYGSYGSGSKPIISGFTRLSKWYKVTGNLYKSSFPQGSKKLNIVVVNGKNTNIGRWPNTGWRKITGVNGNVSISDNTLSGNWTGAEVVIRKERYMIDRSPITSHLGTTINYTATASHNSQVGFGYFIQNSPETIDTLNEWYFDGNDLQMHFVGKPVSVLAASIDTLVYLNSKSNITFDNISFQGANEAIFKLLNCSRITIRNCEIKWSGRDGVYGQGSSYTTLSNCTVDNCNNGGIYLDERSNNATISKVKITNTAPFAGMGISGSGSGNGMMVFGRSSLVYNCSVINSGGGGISFGGDSTTIKNNYVDKFAYVKDDAAGIYTAFAAKGQKVLNNIVLNGIGAPQGTDNPYFLPTYGIYIDDWGNGVEIAYNTVASCSESGIMLHNTSGMDIHHNTLVNNGLSQIQLNRDAPVDNIKNERIVCNIFVSNKGFFYRNSVNSWGAFGVSDSNYYVSGSDSTKLFRLIVSGVITNDISLTKWRSVSGQDIKSSVLPTPERFEYNPTEKSKTISISDNYTDVHGKSYSKKIILLPYSSVVLFKN